MSQYYTPKRVRNLFQPDASEPFTLSRSKIDLFLECPRCFYLDRRLGVSRPPGYPFSLNSAVDALLKKEFDLHRAKKTAHPLIAAYGIDAIPFAHEKMDTWRDALRGGIKYVDPATKFLVTGGVDDVWVNAQGQLHIVDYKSTAKSGDVTLDADWQIGYKRQIEVYQWLFRKNGFDVSPIGYFVYCNGNLDKEAFDGKLEFRVKVIPYAGDDQWIPDALLAARACLMSSQLPSMSSDCDYCRYRKATNEFELTAPPLVSPMEEITRHYEH